MEKILIIDLGSRYGDEVIRYVRRFKVLAEAVSLENAARRASECECKGIIITGDDEKMPDAVNEEIFSLSVPVLGIGAGAAAVAEAFGGEVRPAERLGETALFADNSCTLLASLPAKSACNISFGGQISRVPTGFRITAKATGCPVAAIENAKTGVYALAFRPEKTEQFLSVLKNFLYDICSCHAEWTSASFLRRTSSALKERIAGHRVICMLDGSPEATCNALLLHRAVEGALSCIFINSGLLRKGEAEYIRGTFSSLCGPNFSELDASDRVFGKLIGIADPVAKNKIVREELCRLFEEGAAALPTHAFISLPTLCGQNRLPVTGGAESAVEPLSVLLPEEVAEVSSALGAEKYFAFLSPLSVGGLAVRTEGEATREKIALLSEVDSSFRNRLSLLSAGSKTPDYEVTLSLPRVLRKEGGTREIYTVSISVANHKMLTLDELSEIAEEIVKIENIERVVYDITPKKQSL